VLYKTEVFYLIIDNFQMMYYVIIVHKHSLKIKGVLEDQTAIIGNLSHDDVDRPIMIILNTASDDYKRKKVVRSAKESAQRTFISLGGYESKSLTDVFKTQAKNDIIGRIHSPNEVYPTLDTILEHSKSGLIILDCYDKSSFWTALKALNVSNGDLFPIAELEAFKQNGSVRNSRKPIVKAHELLHYLSPPASFFGIPSSHYVQQVRSAIKVRAPSISLFDQILLASYNRDIQLNKGEGDPFDQKHFNLMGKTIKLGLTIKNIFKRSTEKTVVAEVKERINPTKLAWELKYGDLPTHKHSVLEAPELPFKPLIVISGDVEQAIEDHYRERLGILDLDRILDLEPVLSAELITLMRSQFRQGNHRPPYDNMLIECETCFDVKQGDDSHDYFVLLRLDKDSFWGEDSVNVNIFATTKQDDGTRTYFLHSEEFTFNLSKDGSLRSINSYCRNENKDQVLSMFGMSHLSTVIAQTLNVLARMNEPDFVEHRVKPQRGVHSFKKGHFSYFEAIDVSNFSPASRYLTVDAEGKVSNGVALHPVRRHQRRIFDKETGALREVITVKAHLRGSAAIGVRARTHDFDSK
jgi:hypothetical protein